MSDQLARTLIAGQSNDTHAMTIAVMWLLMTDQVISKHQVCDLMGKPRNWLSPSIDTTGERGAMLATIQDGLQNHGVTSPATRLRQQLDQANTDKAKLSKEIEQLKANATKASRLAAGCVAEMWEFVEPNVHERLEERKQTEQELRQETLKQRHLRAVRESDAEEHSDS